MTRLAELRAAVSQRISGAGGGIGALRAAMASIFETVTVTPEQLIVGGEAKPVHYLSGGEFFEPAEPATEAAATEAPTYELDPEARLFIVPTLRPEAYSGAVYEPLASLNEALAALPVKRVPVEFDAASKAENYGTRSPVCE